MRLALALLATAALFGQQPLEILSAVYGAGSQTVDVTERVRALVNNNSLVLTVDIPTLGSDPAPGVGKSLTVRYRLDGRDGEMIARDFEQLRIPLSATAAPATPAAPVAPPSGFSIADLYGNKPAAVPAAPLLRIVSARWGADSNFADVRSAIEPRVQNNALSVRATNQNLGIDPAVGKTKYLIVQYEWQNATWEAQVKENGTLNLPASNARQVAAQPAAPVAAAPQPGASIPPVGQAGGLRVFYARYGGDPNNRVDVRERLRPHLQNDRLSVAVNRDTMGIEPGGSPRILEVIYEYRGRTLLKEIPEGSTLTLP